MCISCHIKLSLAVSWHHYIGEQHRYEAIFSGISLVSRIAAVTICLLQCRLIRTLPVGIIVPVARSTTLPHQIFGHHLHVDRERTITSIINVPRIRIAIFLLKISRECVSITFSGIECETSVATDLLFLKIKPNIHIRHAHVLSIHMHIFHSTYRQTCSLKIRRCEEILVLWIIRIYKKDLIQAITVNLPQ